jgi:hypothetical protein
MNILRQIEIVRGNVEDLSIQIADRLADVDRALSVDIPAMIAQRAAEQRQLERLLHQRLIEIDEMERFTDDAKDISNTFGPEVDTRFVGERNQGDE